MGEIHINARFGPIDPADLAELKELAARLMVATRTEPGTLRYDWFFDEDETHVDIREIYADSASVFVHMGNAGDGLVRLGELGGPMVLDVYGDQSPELRAALTPMGARNFSHFQSK
jgi:quinol monooxygenase YgiN